MTGYSTDLRERVVSALQEGKSQTWVATTFRVSISSVQRWLARYRQTGRVTATVQKRMVGLIRAEEYPALQALVARLPEAQLPQYCQEWNRETGVMVSTKTMSRMLVRLGLRRKKTIAAVERDEVARQAWVDHATTLPARRVTVVDETSTHLDMTSRYARAPRGQRAFAKQRHNYGKNVTLLAGLRLDGMCAPFVVAGGVDTAVFETYVTHVLLPTLRRGDIVVLDNLPVHKTLQVRGLFLAKGVKLLFLPAYSPDLSPIENVFAKLKALLRRARAQTVEALTEAIAQALDSVSPYDAIGYFINAGLLNLDQ